MYELLKILAGLEKRPAEPSFKGQNKKTADKRVFSLGGAFFISMFIAVGLTLLFTSGDWKKEVNNYVSLLFDEIPVENLEPVNTSHLIQYINEEEKISFLYPQAWRKSTTAEEKTNDETLVDVFRSIDQSDGFFEAFYINTYSSEEIVLAKFVDQIEENLLSNFVQIVKASKTLVDGKNTIVIETESQTISTDGESVYPITGRVYVIDLLDKYILIEFNDQALTFAQTYEQFGKVIESIKFIN